MVVRAKKKRCATKMKIRCQDPLFFFKDLLLTVQPFDFHSYPSKTGFFIFFIFPLFFSCFPHFFDLLCLRKLMSKRRKKKEDEKD
jgi:hypothetical protein